MKNTRPIIFLVLLACSPFIHAEKIMVGHFSNSSLSGWQQKEFDGRTHYALKLIDKRTVLASSSANAASGLFKEVRVNLNRNPILHWSWKIKNTLNSENERVKAGDDFTARIYVVFSDGPFFWQTKTLNYVWANQSELGEHWPNPYTSNAHMFAIQPGDAQVNQWQTESRNVLADIQTAFGKNITEIDAIAIMTDTDQTGGSAQAWFGDIWFSDQE